MAGDIRLYAWNPTTGKWEGFEGVVNDFLGKNITNVGNITGKAGGITLHGGSGAGDKLRLKGSSDPTAGNVEFHDGTNYITPAGLWYLHGGGIYFAAATEIVLDAEEADAKGYIRLGKSTIPASGAVSSFIRIYNENNAGKNQIQIGAPGSSTPHILTTLASGQYNKIGDGTNWFIVDETGNITFSGAQTVDGVDVSAHDPATTGVHGVGGNTIEHTGNKNTANGYAGLDASVDISLAQIPDTLTGKEVSKHKFYSQAGEPDVPADTFAFWRDTTNNKTYLIIDRAGTQEKVQLS